MQELDVSAIPEKLTMQQKLVYGFGDTGFSLTGTIRESYNRINRELLKRHVPNVE